MLSLGRNPGEYIVINGNIFIKVVSNNGSLGLAIDAPRNINIVRGEVFEKTNPVPSCIRRLQTIDGQREEK